MDIGGCRRTCRYNLGEMRVTWVWPGNSLERNWQLRPYIAATARVTGNRPGGRGSDELRTPDLRELCRPGGRGPVPGLPRLAGSRTPPALRPRAPGRDRRNPGAQPPPAGRAALRPL